MLVQQDGDKDAQDAVSAFLLLAVNDMTDFETLSQWRNPQMGN